MDRAARVRADERSSRFVKFATGGGLVGGVLFGVVLLIFGSDPARVAWLVGGESAIAGWAALLILGMALGLLYTFTFGYVSHTWARGVGFGVAHGVIWWIIGVIILMPLLLGYPMGTLTLTTFANLVGYLVVGVLVGLAHAWLGQREAGEAEISTADTEQRERDTTS